MAGLDPATVRDMSADIDDMDKIIGQFLDFATGEEPVEGDLASLVLDAAQAYAATRFSGSGRIDPLPAMRFRPLAIRRCLNNLIDNALRHAGEDKPVELSCMLIGPEACIEVSDRGPGIPPDQIERLKRPFTRLDNSRTGQSGAGLGLAIVERTLRAHGGRFELVQREGGGLVARLLLPVTTAANGSRTNPRFSEGWSCRLSLPWLPAPRLPPLRRRRLYWACGRAAHADDPATAATQIHKSHPPAAEQVNRPPRRKQVSFASSITQSPSRRNLRPSFSPAIALISFQQSQLLNLSAELGRALRLVLITLHESGSIFRNGVSAPFSSNRRSPSSWLKPGPNFSSMQTSSLSGALLSCTATNG